MQMLLRFLIIAGLSFIPLFLEAAPSATAPLALEKPQKLMNTLKDLMNPTFARKTFEQLAKMGRESIPTLQEMLKGKNMRLIRAALDLIDKLGCSPDELGQDLTKILLDKKFGGLRVRAAKLLGKMGGSVGDFVPALISTLKDPNIKVKLAAAESLIDLALKRSKSLPELVKELSKPDNPIRKSAIEGLISLSQVSHPAMPLILKYAQKGRIEPTDVVSLFIPKILPGAQKLANLAFESVQNELNSDGLNPDAAAVELQDAEAEEDGNIADAASSFEDIPAAE